MRTKKNSLRVAIYARVSTDNKGQDPLNQLLQLREFVSKQDGWVVTKEYIDHSTGKNGDRDGFRAMRDDASHHRFDLLLFWSLDRLSREGAFQTLQYLKSLSDHGIKFKSYTEQYLDTLGIFGDAIVAILATLAKQFSIQLSEKTKAGMAKAKAKGAKFGRPKVAFDVAKAKRLRKSGASFRAIAAKTGVSPAYVYQRIGR
jgi:DNA invertase Pin-like site-specific DNA recombinase